MTGKGDSPLPSDSVALALLPHDPHVEGLGAALRTRAAGGVIRPSRYTTCPDGRGLDGRNRDIGYPLCTLMHHLGRDPCPRENGDETVYIPDLIIFQR